MPFHDDCIRFPRGGAQEKRRRKRRPLCEQRDLVSVMNNTRWRKLRAAMLALAPSSPSYRIQNVENGVGGRALARCRSRGPNLMVPPWVLRLTVPQLRSRLALALTYRAVRPDALFATILVVGSIAGTSPGNRE